MISSRYDRVLIGSSPMCLIEATHRAELGERVLIVDRRSRAGGAWATIPWSGWPRVETACHVIINYQGVYEFLSERVGCDLRPQTPRPFFVFRGRRFDHRFPIEELRQLYRHLGPTEVWDLCREAALLPFRPHRWQRFLYPRRGAAELVDRLTARARAAGVELRLNSPVEALELDGRGVRLELADGDVASDVAVVTSRSTLPTIVGRQVRPELPSIERRWIHVNLLLDEVERTEFSYAAFLKHPSISRVSDVTSYLDGVRPGRRLLCVQTVHADLPPLERRQTSAEELVAALRELELVRGDARLVRHRWNSYPFRRLTDVALARIERELGPRVAVLRTPHLAASMSLYRQRWQTRGTA